MKNTDAPEIDIHTCDNPHETAGKDPPAHMEDRERMPGKDSIDDFRFKHSSTQISNENKLRTDLLTGDNTFASDIAAFEGSISEKLSELTDKIK